MNRQIPDGNRHVHVFQEGDDTAERKTRAVVWITAAMMAVEIVGGLWFNSMAVLADGLHMGSHALAIGLSSLAYFAARRWARDPRFAFGTWKVEVLGGFTSAIILVGVAAMMIFTSVERIVSPRPIRYQEAIVVAIVGLAVNVISALILGRGHRHDHDHGSHHDHDDDLNLKAAYVHVITDAATSVLAIVALAGGWAFGWQWLDPAMGIAGAVLVAVWAKGLIGDTAKVLLDREMDAPIVDEIQETLQPLTDDGRTAITDLHVWRVGQSVYSCTLTLSTTNRDLTPAAIRDALAAHREVVHTTIEINPDRDAD